MTTLYQRACQSDDWLSQPESLCLAWLGHKAVNNLYKLFICPSSFPNRWPPNPPSNFFLGSPSVQALKAKAIVSHLPVQSKPIPPSLYLKSCPTSIQHLTAVPLSLRSHSKTGWNAANEVHFSRPLTCIQF